MSSYIAKILKVDETQLAGLDNKQIDKAIKQNVIRRAKNTQSKMTKEEEEKLIEQQKLMFEEMQGQDEEAEDEPDENDVPATTTEGAGIPMVP